MRMGVDKKYTHKIFCVFLWKKRRKPYKIYKKYVNFLVEKLVITSILKKILFIFHIIV